MRTQIFAWMLGLFVVSACAGDTMRVRVLDLAPVSYQATDGHWVGRDVELSHALLAEAGYTPAYQILPWRRALAQLENGELDMLANMIVTPERQNFTHFIGPVREESSALVVLKNKSLKINSLDDIKKIDGKIGVVMGSYYGEAFRIKFENDKEFAAKFEVLPQSGLNIKKLNSGRIVGLLADSVGIAYRIKNDADYANATIHSFVVNKDMVYFGFSKKSVSEAALNRLSDAFKRLKATGQVEEIIGRYK